MLSIEEIQKRINVVINLDKSKALNTNLQAVSALLNASNNGQDKNKIKDALLYMEWISYEIAPENTTSTFSPLALLSVFSSPVKAKTTHMITALAYNPDAFPPESTVNQIDHVYQNFDYYKPDFKPPTLTSQEMKYIFTIHALLMPYCSWEFTYPKNDNDEVMNDSIQNWQEAYQTPILSGTPFRDLVRAKGDEDKEPIKIDGKESKTVIEVENNLSYLLRRTNYTPNEKEELYTWMQYNADQDISSFVDGTVISLMTEELLKLVPLPTLRPGEDPEALRRDFRTQLTRASVQNWYVENGKVYYSYIADINTIQNASTDTLLIKDPSGKTAILQGQGQVGNAMENLNDKVKKKIPIDPLVHVETKVELVIENVDGKISIKPKVDELKLQSFTGYLQSPDLLPTKKLVQTAALPEESTLPSSRSEILPSHHDPEFSNEQTTVLKSSSAPSPSTNSFLINPYGEKKRLPESSKPFPQVDGQITTNEIKAWQDNRIDSRTEEQGINDMTRENASITIKGENFAGKTRKDVSDALELLVKEARSYNETDTTLLKNWLTQKGDQGMIWFIPLIFASQGWSLNGTKISSMDWHVENGKICLDLKMHANAVINLRKNVGLFMEDQKPAEGTVDAMGVSKNPNPPILDVSSKIELEVVNINGNPTVKPIVTSLRFDSYHPKFDLNSTDFSPAPRSQSPTRGFS